MFLKVVLADNLAPVVDEAYAMNPEILSGIDVITLGFLFGFQIYFDFAAYSHIALGAAKVLGISIPENFNFPYIATSMKDFWKRWHISLSSWIRDYLYLPLTGTKVLVSTGKGGIGQSLDNQPSAKRKNFALFATWAIMGFWHGSNWTFILWGLYHAVFIFIERKLAPLRQRVHFLTRPIVTWPLTLGIAMISWIPFRAQSLSDALVMYSKILNPGEFLGMNLRENSYLVAALMLIVFIATWASQRFVKPLIKQHKFLEAPVLITQYTIAILFIFVFLRPINQFIYFQF